MREVRDKRRQKLGKSRVIDEDKKKKRNRVEKRKNRTGRT